MAITFEEYIRSQVAKGACDFTFRASCYNNQVQIYIHPQRVNEGEIGNTTPSVRVQHDTIIWPAGWSVAVEER